MSKTQKAHKKFNGRWNHGDSARYPDNMLPEEKATLTALRRSREDGWRNGAKVYRRK